MYLLDLLGTFAFAITGAYKAKGAGLHIFGVILLGIITAVGGGTFRDLLINRVPLFYLKDQNYLLMAILASIATYIAPTFFKKRYSYFRLVDSIGLAAFVIIGTSIGYSHLFKTGELNIFSFIVSVFLGMLTGFGGSIIRDSIMGSVPLSLRKGSNYATSAFLGASSFYFLMFINIQVAVIISLVLTLFLREIISEFGIYKRILRKK